MCVLVIVMRKLGLSHVDIRFPLEKINVQSVPSSKNYTGKRGVSLEGRKFWYQSTVVRYGMECIPTGIPGFPTDSVGKL